MTMVADATVVLASSSPRRKQLLEEAGIAFEAVDPPVAEPVDIQEGVLPARLAEALAYFKARSVAESRPNALVLGADTVVSLAGEILGKPADAEDARRMLHALSDTRQAVITGVALLGVRKRCIASETTYVTMRKITDDEIEQYIESGEWRGKAGAYAIQETADRFVTAVEGSFSNVVGLPMELVTRLLRLAENRRQV
ncbi:MAG: Maf family protein [Phycisphaerae bacterium]